MKRKIAILVGGALALLLLVLLARAATFTIDQPPIEPIERLAVETGTVAARLARAIRVPTTTRGRAPYYDADAFLTLHRLIEAEFPNVHQKLEREKIGDLSLLYSWKGSDPNLAPILLMAHQDVVPIIEGTEAEWTHPPFSGAIADGFVWGRGTLDVKSGLFGILEAVDRLVADGFQPARTIHLAFGHDEEIGGRGGAKKIAEHLKSKQVKLELVLDEGGVIIEGVIPGVSEPVALVGVAEKGYLSLELSVRAKGGHSSMPPSQTAIGILSAGLARLEANPFETRTEFQSRFFDYVGPKMAFSRKILFANLWLFRPLLEVILGGSRAMDAGMRTTIAITMFNAGVKDNVLPIEAKAVVNHRIIPGETTDTVMAYVKATLDDPRIEIRPYADEEKGFGSNPSPVSDIDSESFRAISETIRGIGDPSWVVAPYLVVGGTDSRYFSPLSNNVYRFSFNRMKASDIPRVHGTNERISVENYADCIRFYYALIRRTAGPEAAIDQRGPER